MKNLKKNWKKFFFTVPEFLWKISESYLKFSDTVILFCCKFFPLFYFPNHLLQPSSSLVALHDVLLEHRLDFFHCEHANGWFSSWLCWSIRVLVALPEYSVKDRIIHAENMGKLKKRKIRKIIFLKFVSKFLKILELIEKFNWT